MSHSLTETGSNAVFTVGLTVPDNGDDFDDSCELVVGADGQLADRTQWLYGWFGSSPRSKVNLGGAWASSFTRDASVGAWNQSAISSSAHVSAYGTFLPTGRKITGATATIRNPLTANVAIGTMPKLEVVKRSMVTGTETILGSQSDTTAVLATYQAFHSVTVTGLSSTIDDNNEYYLRLRGEDGANAVTGLQLARMFFTLGF